MIQGEYERKDEKGKKGIKEIAEKKVKGKGELGERNGEYESSRREKRGKRNR